MFAIRPFHDSNEASPILTTLTTLTTFTAFFSLPLVVASPVVRCSSHGCVNEVDLARRQQTPPDRKPTISPSIWVPIVVVAGLICGLAILSWTSKRIRALITRSNTTATTTAPATRELTAEQLAGTINNGNATTPAPAAGAGGRTRRTRRPRRTPSQMSVTSLPEYNKEPGELELVIIRGEDSEDAQTAAVARAIPEEDDDSVESGENTRNARYSPVPTNDMNDSRDTTDHLAPNANPPHSSRETTALLSDNGTPSTTEVDARGEAPPYFEVVDPASLPATSSVDQPQPTSATSQTTSSSSPGGLSPPASPERRSGIRTFFNRMSVAGAPRGFTHVRGNSSISTDNSHADSPSAASPPSGSRHRATPSSTSSIFRTLTRQRSQSTLHSGNASARLNSPSLISLNSISAPLTHTVVRTDITYPKTGPTPEQLKMISSRESIGRFAVPYGQAAIAYASNSRLDLTSPPPDFDTVMASRSTTSLHVRNDSSGLRSPSPLGQHASPPTSAADGLPISSEPHSQAAITGLPSSSTNTNTTEAALADSHDDKVTPEQSIAAKYKALPFSASTVGTVGPSRNRGEPNLTINEFGMKVPASADAPPSSFHLNVIDATMTSAGTSRSESRASVLSSSTFETAAESLASRRARTGNNRISTTDTDSDEYMSDDDGPSTPVMQSTQLQDVNVTPSGHKQEATDATILAASSSLNKRDTIVPS